MGREVRTCLGKNCDFSQLSKGLLCEPRYILILSGQHLWVETIGTWGWFKDRLCGGAALK